ncbi:MAG: ubiquinol-cytochrome C chaperone [Proteobacteria bacterium]|nr:ubiquinol-cytochrome C chaperone [Pseudomonadota bacterium]
MFNLQRVFRRNPDLIPARALYEATIRASRNPYFFITWGVEDTPEGRFEMLAVHAFLALRRLKAIPAANLAQTYFDLMFADIDDNLRELGVGDMAVGRKVKKLAAGFYGRLAAYEHRALSSRHRRSRMRWPGTRWPARKQRRRSPSPPPTMSAGNGRA